jgi:transcriptional regulator GlxA family with amidase domain
MSEKVNKFVKTITTVIVDTYYTIGVGGVVELLAKRLQLIKNDYNNTEDIELELITAIDEFCVVFESEKKQKNKQLLLKLIIKTRSNNKVFENVLYAYTKLLKEDESKDENDALVHRIKMYLHRCSAKELGLLSTECLADQFQMRRDKLSRFFKEKTGLTLHSYILHVKLSKAFDLLSDSNDKKTITQVAKTLGIKNLTEFKEHFKQIFKLNPLDIKK